MCRLMTVIKGMPAVSFCFIVHYSPLAERRKSSLKLARRSERKIERSLVTRLIVFPAFYRTLNFEL